MSFVTPKSVDVVVRALKTVTVVGLSFLSSLCSFILWNSTASGVYSLFCFIAMIKTRVVFNQRNIWQLPLLCWNILVNPDSRWCQYSSSTLTLITLYYFTLRVVHFRENLLKGSFLFVLLVFCSLQNSTWNEPENHVRIFSVTVFNLAKIFRFRSSLPLCHHLALLVFCRSSFSFLSFTNFVNQFCRSACTYFLFFLLQVLFS